MSVHLEEWINLKDRPVQTSAAWPNVGGPEHKVTRLRLPQRRSALKIVDDAKAAQRDL